MGWTSASPAGGDVSAVDVTEKPVVEQQASTSSYSNMLSGDWNVQKTTFILMAVVNFVIFLVCAATSETLSALLSFTLFIVACWELNAERERELAELKREAAKEEEEEEQVVTTKSKKSAKQRWQDVANLDITQYASKEGIDLKQLTSMLKRREESKDTGASAETAASEDVRINMDDPVQQLSSAGDDEERDAEELSASADAEERRGSNAAPSSVEQNDVSVMESNAYGGDDASRKEKKKKKAEKKDKKRKREREDE